LPFEEKKKVFYKKEDTGPEQGEIKKGSRKFGILMRRKVIEKS